MTSKLNPERAEHSESLFHHLVDSVQDYAIFALDPEGQIVSWNRGAQHLKGYTEAEVLGRHFSIFYPEEHREREKPAAMLAAAAEHGRVEDEDWRLRKDGSRFWANVVITALRNSDGELVGYAKVTRDLTERRAAEDALRSRERQLTDTQRLAGLGSWVWDAETDRVTWSEELYQIYGLGPQSFGATFEAYLERVHPDDRDRVRTKIENAYRTGDAFEFEERIVRPDGGLRVLRSRGRAVQDESGRTLRLTGACFDITEQKRAEEQAIELAREQSARATAEATAAGLRLLVRSSEVLASSLHYEDTLRNVAELVVPEVADWCAVDLVGENGELHRVAVAHPDPSRVELARRYMERYPPSRDAETGTWHVISTGETEFYPDIPDELLVSSVQDEEQLATLRELGLRSAISVPLVGRSGVLGSLTLVQSESDRRLSETDVWVAQELGRHAALAIENARLHGELEERNTQLEAQAAELELKTEELETQAQHLEELMTELEATNEELQMRTAEAEQANRAKSEFLAAMSHELRTPLNAIFGYADLLELGLHGPVSTAQVEALDRIKRNQRVLLALINDVLNFARLEAGKLDLNITDVAVCELLDGLEAMVAPQVRAKQLHYECGSCGPDVHVRGEPERIEQVLLNLLTNAVKFTEPGGRITLSVEPGAEEVRLVVRDTGRGIPPEQLQSIFDPFVQIDRVPANVEDRGVGLGLAISRDLAEAMGGTLSVQSRVGEGSTFTLTLPRGK